MFSKLGDVLARLTRENRADAPVVLPTLFAGIPRLSALRAYGMSAAEIAVQYFVEAGYFADRSVVRNQRGYGARLIELAHPASWTGDDRQLIEHVADTDLDVLVDAFARDWRARRPGTKKYKAETVAMLSEGIRETASLGQRLGVDGFWSVYDVLYDLDDVALAPGCPDVLVWDRDSQSDLWFFVEVKVIGDSLRESQVEWIYGNWKRIEGRVALAYLLDSIE